MKLARWAALIALSGLAPALSATAIDLKLGSRSFDEERWPEVGVAIAVGPDERWVRPAFGAAVAFDFVYGGTVLEASAGLAGDFPHRERLALSWGLGAAFLDYDYGPNHGTAEAIYGELGLRWVRADGLDFGVNLRYLDGSDVRLRTVDSDDPGFRESISTTVVSFVVRW